MKARLLNEPKKIGNESAVNEKIHIDVKNRKIVDSFCGQCNSTVFPSLNIPPFKLPNDIRDDTFLENGCLWHWDEPSLRVKFEMVDRCFVND